MVEDAFEGEPEHLQTAISWHRTMVRRCRAAWNGSDTMMDAAGAMRHDAERKRHQARLNVLLRRAGMFRNGKDTDEGSCARLPHQWATGAMLLVGLFAVPASAQTVLDQQERRQQWQNDRFIERSYNRTERDFQAEQRSPAGTWRNERRREDDRRAPDAWRDGALDRGLSGRR